MGMLGLETALPVVIETMIETKRLTWREVADRMSVAPAHIGRVADHGQPIAVGSTANLTVVDPTITWTVEPQRLASKSRNTPYAARTMHGKVLATFLRGKATVLDGRLVP